MTKEQLIDLFDADNIKNFSEEDPHVSVSVHKFFKTYGGYKGLARALKTDIKNGINGDDIEIRQRVFGANAK